MDQITIQERGWAGHFILGDRCRYRRNTLISKNGKYIVVSSVGNLHIKPDSPAETIGHNRWYETLAFIGRREGPYIEIDVGQEIFLPDNIEQGIYGENIDDLPVDADNVADKIHDRVVQYIAQHFDELYEATSGRDHG